MRILLLVAALAACLPALADEGMWTFDNFPVSAVQKTYGVELTPAWLEHVRLSTIRLTNCTASFVSPEGLILTNYHCVESCLAELSSKDNSLLDRGYAAAKPSDERRCSTQLADVLVGMDDVSPAIASAIRGLGDLAANDARKKKLTELEQACEQASAKAKSGHSSAKPLRFIKEDSIVIYKYKRYDDVRMVFAPEGDIAAFGGDPDNFQFPRWSLDFSILRAYEHGKPAKTPNYLQIDFAGPQLGQPVFVSGHPAGTQRLETHAQLKFERDISVPSTLLRLSELRGRYIQFGRVVPANEELVEAPLHGLENSLKVRRKLLDALHDDAMMERKSADEAAFRSIAQMSGPDPWTEIEKASIRERTLYSPQIFIEGGAGFNSILFRYARILLRAADERTKPNTQRLREYTDVALPRLEQQIEARVPIYSEAETLTLSFSLQRMRELLGPDHPVMRNLFIRDSPDTLATRLVAETHIDDPSVRKKALGWRQGRRGCFAGSHDRTGSLARPRVSGHPQTIRRRNRGADIRCRRAHRRRALQSLWNQGLPGCHVHAAPELRQGARIAGKRRRGRAFHPLGSRLRASDGGNAVQDSGQLDEGEGPARHANRFLHLDNQRHRRRQLRQPVARFHRAASSA